MSFSVCTCMFVLQRGDPGSRVDYILSESIIRHRDRQADRDILCNLTILCGTDIKILKI